MNQFTKKTTLWLSILAITISATGCSLLQGTKEVDPQVKELQSQVQDLQNKLEAVSQKVEASTTPVVTPTDVTTTDIPTTSTPVPPPAPTETKSTYNGESFIVVQTPKNEASLYEAPIFFKGNVSPNTTKIGVKATNSNSTQVDDYVLSKYVAGNTNFSYGASEEWSNLAEGSNTYVFTAYFQDGSIKSTKVTIYYTHGGAEMGKPVIYLYPTKETKVFVNVKPTSGITVSEPAINDGWNVWATPEGKITNIADNTVYPYLFWEGIAANFITPKEGFVVAQKDVSTFFDKKLSYLGLNSKEIADFKEFWVPKFTEKPYYFITFIDQASIDGYAPLTVSPKPDSVIRVFFDYKGLDKSVKVTEQKLKAATRSGFAVTEWGGRLY